MHSLSNKYFSFGEAEAVIGGFALKNFGGQGFQFDIAAIELLVGQSPQELRLFDFKFLI